MDLERQGTRQQEQLAQLTGMLVITLLISNHALSQATQRANLLERRIVALEERGATARQRARRSRDSVVTGEGTRADPLAIDLTNEDRLRGGLPPRPGPRTPSPVIPGLDNVNTVPIPVPYRGPGAEPSQAGPVRRGRLSSRDRARWMRPIDSDEDPTGGLYD